MFYFLLGESTGVVGNTFATKAAAVRFARRMARHGFLYLVVRREAGRDSVVWRPV